MPELSSDASEAQALLIDIADGLNGTRAQSEALRYLQGVGFQSLIIDCMAEQGFTYRGVRTLTVPSPSGYPGDGLLDPLSAEAVESDGLGLEAVLGGLVRAAKAGEPLTVDETPHSGRTPAEHEVPGWDDAALECEQAADEQLPSLVAHPPYEDTFPFYDLLDEVIASESVQERAANYPECMAEAGWALDPSVDGGARGQLVRQLVGRFQDLLIEERPSWSEEPGQRSEEVDRLIASEEWQDLLGMRLRASADDAACRHGAAEVALTALVEPLRRFQEENRDLLERRRAQWGELERRASQTPDPAAS